ncbi:DUF1810 domain-containing protein [Paracoccus aestuarii]|uniref:DUF1810 domain-containing protein n=1 Tax=Paracoccus aestuarii TaxID=453842 RepID=A0A418ZQ93_9RHOB|nr:DUF1810 domain-containing protein [Paracoccus aestuarii]RJK97364.1 DUF1810 domain-containing protein [Paracoccus aestuarii]WCQ98307.1 DUF1810 domain-containing protein [Paracoccus aestuarii]
MTDPSRDPASLDRFVTAQRGTHDAALAQLRRGRKTGHWMWFVFPQLRGLGRSQTAQVFGIADLDEARDYLAHPILGPRLRDCTAAMLGHDALTAEDILGPVDAMKLRSSATLFAAAGQGPEPFDRVIAQFYGGQPCQATLAMLGRGGAR